MTSIPMAQIAQETRAACQAAYDSDPLRAISRIAGDTAGIVEQVKHSGPLPHAWQELVQRAQAQGGADAPISDAPLNVARYLLLEKILNFSLDRVPSLPLPPDVVRYLYDDYRFVAEPERISLDCLEPNSYPLSALCREACLDRFPAGQVHFEETGFPRSWFLKLPRREVCSTAWHILVRMGGFKPYYSSHNAHRKKFSAMFLEKEQRRSMVRIAEMLELHPHVLGFMGSGWLHSPNLGVASPHLKWMMEINRELVALGAAYTTLGPAPEGSGFLVGDKRRIALYQAGEWKPMDGLLLAPRASLIQWARTQKV